MSAVGPKLFTACPMDVNKSSVWFTDLWNYFIVSYLAEAVRQSLQVHAVHCSTFKHLSLRLAYSRRKR